MSSDGADVAEFLRGLRGVRGALPIGSAEAGEVLSAEERYEGTAALPIRNLGVTCALASSLKVAILKDAEFRGPPTATVYLVEEGPAVPGEELRVADRVFHVIGEELMTPPPAGAAEGPAFAISDAFALYPERRTDATRPSRFLLPPVPFPELLAPPWAGRLRSVVSGSPSPLGDVVLRRICGFDEDPALATLVIGFDPAP